MATPDFTKFDEQAHAASAVGTTPPAKALLEQIGLLPSPPSNAVVLDNACSSGVVAACLLEGFSSSPATDLQLVCGDLEPVMVEACNARMKKHGWNAKSQILDAQANPYPDNHFTHCLMNFGPQLMSDPILAMKETHRVLCPGGLNGFSCWVNPGWRANFCAVFPSFTPPPSKWIEPSFIHTTLSDLGFQDIKLSPLKFDTHEPNVDGHLHIMRILMGPRLAGENGERYEKFLREKYGDGPMVLTWEALIVTCAKA